MGAEGQAGKREPMSYDVKCDELARYFLADAEEDVREECVKELAQVIQDAIESYLDGSC